MLVLDGLCAGYSGLQILHELDITVEQGEIVALVGANGAGKTTTLRAVSGLLRPTGRIEYAGRDLSRVPGQRRVALGIGHVPEGRHIFPDQTVTENLLLGAFVHRRDKGRIRTVTDEVLELFPRLAERRAQLAGTLSGGEAQMLAVARALMSQPRLLMLDEPSLGLAPMRAAEMFGYLSRLHTERGLAVLLVEQQATTALRIADRGYVLERGRVAVEGTAAQLREDPRVQVAYLGGLGEVSAG